MKRKFSPSYHNKKPSIKGVPLQKKHGQYFLRNHAVVQEMVQKVPVAGNSIFEIGCGDGFLTREIMRNNPERLWIFEIDPAWADTVNLEFGMNDNFTMHTSNILDIDFSVFEQNQPWILLSNLPYHVTFPILHKVFAHRHMIQEGVVMMQEEVAQKIVKKGGKGYGYISLFFQHYFDWTLMTKILPGSFYPEPKVNSRLLHFVPKKNVKPIVEEEQFWKFIKYCFSQPRRTLRNNLLSTHYDIAQLDEKLLNLRAQQLSFDNLYDVWVKLH